MAEHSELVSEMSLLEKMSTQDRLKMARKRRLQQLKKWNQREKEHAAKSKKRSDILSSRAFKKSSASTTTTTSSASSSKRTHDYKVHFVPSVMLLEAAARSDIDEVRRLLLLNVSPDSANEDGLTALHQCCIDDSEDMMKLLIDFGANVNARDTEQWTPLHAAATCGHLHLVKYLISRGADLLSVNADGNMPYDICEDETTLDFIEGEMAKRGITQQMIDDTRSVTENQMLRDLRLIASQEGDFEYRDVNGVTPLHIAAANGYVSVVEFLLDQHVSTDVIDADSWQPVHAAACWGHPDVLDLLVQSGADLSARTKNGETPIDMCEDPELKERILQLQSEMESKRGSLSNKLKRTHSSNTRSQSIRRTSIREKNQISRREAREEGRIMRQDVIEDDNVTTEPAIAVAVAPTASSSSVNPGVITLSSEEEESSPHPMNAKTSIISQPGDASPVVAVVESISDHRLMNHAKILPNGSAGNLCQESESRNRSSSARSKESSASCNGSPIKDPDAPSCYISSSSNSNNKGTWSKKSITTASSSVPASVVDLNNDPKHHRSQQQQHQHEQTRSHAAPQEDSSSIHSSSSTPSALLQHHLHSNSIMTVNPCTVPGRVNAVSPMISSSSAAAAVLLENNNTIKSNGRTMTPSTATATATGMTKTSESGTSAAAIVHPVNPYLHVVKSSATSTNKRDHVDQIDSLPSHLPPSSILPASSSSPSSPFSQHQHENLVQRTSSRESVKVEIHVTVNTTSTSPAVTAAAGVAAAPCSMVQQSSSNGIMNKTTKIASSASPLGSLIGSQSITSLPCTTPAAAAVGSGIQVMQPPQPFPITATSLLPSGTTLSDLKKHRSIARRSAGNIMSSPAASAVAVVPASTTDSKSSSVHLQSQHQHHCDPFTDNQLSQLSRSSVPVNGKETSATAATAAAIRDANDHVNWRSPNNNTILSTSYSSSSIGSTPVHTSCHPPSYDQPNFPPNLDLSLHDHALDMSGGGGASPPASPTSVLKKFRSDPSEVYGGGGGNSGSAGASSKRGCCVIS